MKLRIITLLCFFFSWISLASNFMLVEKQKFSTTNFKTFNGNIIPEVNVGWESYGKLNAAKDNAILITHYFSGNSHAAGKYNENDPLPGYWDSIIGPGKAIDTNKYFVVSVDTLVNASWHDPNVITTGPASINPKTGKPYGLDFPVVTIRDFVNVQKLVIEQLGITKLHAVMGASMGSFQALEWAVTYPDMVERLIHVIGMAEMDAWTVSALEKWAMPIRLDPNWNGGDYYGGARPMDGLTATMLNITQDAMHPAIYAASFPGFKVMDKGALNDINTHPKTIETLYQRGRARAMTQDANHVLYLVRASQLFVAGHNGDLQKSLDNIKAKTLLLPASNDLLLRPEHVRRLAKDLAGKNKAVQIEEIKGIWGHLDGIFSIQPHGETIKKFLEEKTND